MIRIVEISRMVLYILGGNGEEEGVSLLRGLKCDIAFFLLSRTLEREASILSIISGRIGRKDNGYMGKKDGNVAVILL